MLRRIFTLVGYFVLVLLVVGVTAALVAYGQGYTYDFGSGRVVQKGLVIINSAPSGLALSENGKLLKRKKTPYHGSYEPGAYQFSMTKDGFWPWQKTLQVIAGEVTLAQYAIMVPKKPATTTLDSRAQIVAQSISRDHRHLAYITGGADQAVYTLDLGNPKPVKLYTAKAAAGTVPVEMLRDVTWSDDASHLLIHSQVGDQAVDRLIAGGGGDATNLTEQYGFALTGLKFSGSNWKQLYWISPDGLRRLDVDAKSVSAVLADKVTQIWTTPDRVLYVQQTDLGRSLWSLDSRGHKQELIQALAESDSYSVAYASYQGQDELAVVPAKTGTGTLYTDIFGSTPIAKTIARGVTAASFSGDGHLLAFSSPTATYTYDLERSQVDNTLVLYGITDQPGTLQSLTWFDNFHLLSNRDGHLYWSEFDGANRVDLGAVAGGFPAYGMSDFKSVVMFSLTGNAVKVNKVDIKQ